MALEDLEAQARYDRERYDLYRARSYGGGRPTDPARLRELQRAAEASEDRLRAARALEARTPPPA